MSLFNHKEILIKRKKNSIYIFIIEANIGNYKIVII